MLRDNHRNQLEINMHNQQHNHISATNTYQYSTSMPSVPNLSARRILRLKQITELTGLSRSAIYDRLDPKSKRHDSSFPKQVKLGGSTNAAVGWVESEVMAWIDQCCRVG